MCIRDSNKAENEKDIKFFENEEDLEESLEDFSMSLAELAEHYGLTEENRILKEQVGYLTEQFKIIEGARLSTDKAGKLARKILKRYGSKYNADTLQKHLVKLSEYIGNGQNVDSERLLRATSGLAKKILSESEIIDDTLYNEYKDIRDYLKNTKIKVNDTLKKEIESQYDCLLYTSNNWR